MEAVRGWVWIFSGIAQFLCLFLRRHLAGKPQVVVSLNVNCFLWLSYLVLVAKQAQYAIGGILFLSYALLYLQV